MEIADYINNIERKLYNSFDIKRDVIINDYKYDLFAEHHLRTERYILTRKTVIDVMESNEYCFIKYFKIMDIESLHRYINLLIQSIDSQIELNKGHMSSYITGVMILDNKPSVDILEIVEKFKFHKGFAFGFKGWVDIRLILVIMNQKCIVTNKKGKEVVDLYAI